MDVAVDLGIFLPELFDLMGELQLYGMKVAFDEIMATAIRHTLKRTS